MRREERVEETEGRKKIRSWGRMGEGGENRRGKRGFRVDVWENREANRKRMKASRHWTGVVEHIMGCVYC